MPIVTLRPNGSSGTGVVTGSSAHAATSDDSDDTFVTFTSAQATAFLFDTYALQPGEVAASVTPRIRLAAASAPGTYTFNLQAETTGAIMVLHPYGSPYSIGTSIETVTLPTFTAQAAGVGVGFSQAQIDGLVMRFKLANPSPTTKSVYELFLDVLVVGAPAVSVTAPSSTVSDTTRPLIIWDYTPGEDAAVVGSGAQAAYQVRLFTAAQAGAGGFDPETSAATWEPGGASGFITSGNQSVRVGVDLINGTTYRAYVRAAQLVNGQYHWSDWDFAEFEVDLDTPLAPQVSLTAFTNQGFVQIEIDENVSEALTIDHWVVERSRTSSSGPWEFVRGWSDDTAPPAHVGTNIARDYEPPVGYPLWYRVQGVAIVGGQRLGGAWQTEFLPAGDTGSWEPINAWLKDPVTPSRNMAVILKDHAIPALARPRRQGIHEPLGRELPVVVSDVFRAERGEVTFITVNNPLILDPNGSDHAALKRLLLSGRVLMLETPFKWGWGSRYIALLGDVEEVRAGGDASDSWRFFTMQFVVVGRPDDEGFVSDT